MKSLATVQTHGASLQPVSQGCARPRSECRDAADAGATTDGLDFARTNY
jgi:hypothetical protein